MTETPTTEHPKALLSPRDITIAQALLVIVAVEGLTMLVATLASPSMERRAVLLGLSAPRLVLQAALAAVVFSLLFAAVKSLVDPFWLDPGFAAFEAHVATHPLRLATLIAASFSASLLTIYILALFAFSLATNAPELVRILMSHFSSTMLWFSVIPPQFCLAVAWLYPTKLREAAKQVSVYPAALLPNLVVLAGSLQCLTLVLRAEWLFRIPGWFWEVIPLRFQLSQALILPFAALALLAIRRLVSSPGGARINVALSVVLLYSLQLAFGVAGGQGIESLRMKYSERGVSNELKAVCMYQGGAKQVITNYEEDYADDYWLGTKPPGLAATFIVLRDFAEWISVRDTNGIDQCFEIVSKTMAYLFPLLASLVVIPLWYLERHLGNRGHSHDSAALYATVPAFILLPLVRDQAIYPILTAVTLLVAARSTLLRSVPLALVAGSLLYFSAFMSFSLLPVAAIAFAFPVILGLSSRQPRATGQMAAVVGSMLCGCAAAWIAGMVLYGYDPVTRYTAAIQAHRTIKGFQTDFPSLSRYALLNSLEFIIAGGAPLMLLLVTSAGLSLRRTLKGLASPRDAFACAVLCSVLVLYAVGQTQGEVARLWLFLFVPITLISAPTARLLTQPPTRGFLTVCLMQILIAFLTFMNMDFR